MLADFAPLAMSTNVYNVSGVARFFPSQPPCGRSYPHFVLPCSRSCLVVIYFAFTCGTLALLVYSVRCVRE